MHKNIHLLMDKWIFNEVNKMNNIHCEAYVGAMRSFFKRGRAYILAV